MDIEKISRTLLTLPTANLTLKLQIKLSNTSPTGEMDSYHKVFDFRGKKYLNLNFMPYISIEFTKKQDGGVWDASKSVMITQRNICHIILALKRLQKAIYGNEIYAKTKQGELIAYKDKVIQYTEKVYNLGNNQRLELVPTVIYHFNEDAYEGIALYMNNSRNISQIPIDELDALIYNLDKVDLFSYSQLMINYYFISTQMKKEDVNKSKNVAASKRVDFVAPNNVESTIRKKEENPLGGYL